MHPHIPRPRRKATRTCTDTAGVVRTVHGGFMWPFTARVNEKTAPIERIAAVAICRRLPPRCASQQNRTFNVRFGSEPEIRRSLGLSPLHPRKRISPAEAQRSSFFSIDEANPIAAPTTAPIAVPSPGTIVPAAPPTSAPEIVRFLSAQALVRSHRSAAFVSSFMLLPSRLVLLPRNEPPLLLVAEINRTLAAVDFCFAFFGGFMSRSCCVEPLRTCGRLAQPIVP